MTATAWKRAAAAALVETAREDLPAGKRRRSAKAKADDLRVCGRQIHGKKCGACDDVLAKSCAIVASCGCRICPICARRRANVLRERLRYAWQVRNRRRGTSLYLITLTLRFDPASQDDLSIDGLRRRKKLIIEGWSSLWRRYLKSRGVAALRAIEVGTSGLVHAHVLYYGLRPDARRVRDLWMFKCGDSPQVDIKYVRKANKAIAEVAKYVCKSGSPVKAKVASGEPVEFIDPRLAARVEMAFSGDRLIESYGEWRGIDPDKDEEPPPDFGGEPCSTCGVVGDWVPFSCSIAAWMAAGRSLRNVPIRTRLAMLAPRSPPGHAKEARP